VKENGERDTRVVPSEAQLQLPDAPTRDSSDEPDPSS
jgi:hypothetical protein